MPDKIIVISSLELAQLIQECVSGEIRKIAALFETKTVALVSGNSEYCFIAEASRITGLAIATIRTKCHLGEMTYYKPAGTKKLQFKKSELIAWVEKSKVKNVQELEEEQNQYLTSKRNKK
ncbi:MAG: hypothetical protein J0L87_03570 [Bacteroidetes bacterium]|nr:hypothetical protein [Bacteroidota bacterium]